MLQNYRPVRNHNDITAVSVQLIKINHNRWNWTDKKKVESKVTLIPSVGMDQTSISCVKSGNHANHMDTEERNLYWIWVSVNICHIDTAFEIY